MTQGIQDPQGSMQSSFVLHDGKIKHRLDDSRNMFAEKMPQSSKDREGILILLVVTLIVTTYLIVNLYF